MKKIKRPGTKFITALVFAVQTKERPVGVERLILPLDSQLEMPLDREAMLSFSDADNLLSAISTNFGLTVPQISKGEKYIAD